MQDRTKRRLVWTGAALIAAFGCLVVAAAWGVGIARRIEDGCGALGVYPDDYKGGYSSPDVVGLTTLRCTYDGGRTATYTDTLVLHWTLGCAAMVLVGLAITVATARLVARQLTRGPAR